MSKILHKIVLLLTVLACTSALFASEAEYNKIAKSWKLNADGSQEFRCSMELTIYTHTAMNGTYGESFIVYNPQYQTLTINESYTRQKNGQIVKTPDNAFVEVLPAAAANAPAYNQLKEMVVVHTGLELGATIYLDYTIKSKAGYLPQLDIYECLEQTSPVKNYQLSISVPQGKKLDFQLLNRKEKAKETTENGQTCYTWNISQIPARSRWMDVYRMDEQTFVANTYDSVQQLAENLYTQLETRKSMPLLTLAEALTEKAQSEKEKIIALYRYIQESYALIPLTLTETGFRIRPAEDVINSAYATPAELMNIFQGLLKAAGLKADMYAFLPGTGMKSYTFYVKTEADGIPYLLACNPASTEKIKAFAQYYPALNLSTGQLEEPQLKSGKVSILATITCQPKGETFTASAKAHISNLLLDLEGKQLKHTGQLTIQQEDADFTDLEFSQELATETAGDYRMLELPEYPSSHLYEQWAGQGSDSNLLITLPQTPDESYTFTLDIPQELEICTPDCEKEWENKLGRVYVKIGRENGKLKIERSFRMNTASIREADYAQFMTLVKAWCDKNYKTILFRK